MSAAHPGARVARHETTGRTGEGEDVRAITVTGGRYGTRPIKAYICSYRHDRGETVCTNNHRRPVERRNARVTTWVKSSILSDELVIDSLKEVRRRLAAKREATGQGATAARGEAHKLRAHIATIIDILAETPKAKTEGLMTGLNERQEELNALDAQIRGSRPRPKPSSSKCAGWRPRLAPHRAAQDRPRTNPDGSSRHHGRHLRRESHCHAVSRPGTRTKVRGGAHCFDRKNAGV